MQPLISVIVPVYNVENYLDKCVDSIVNQTYKNLEIILVDDGSPDNCPQMCDEWAKKDSRIKVIHKENGGVSSARNAGLDIAKGDYVGFIDSDDYIESNMYELLKESIESDDTDLAVCGLFLANGEVKSKYSNVYNKETALKCLFDISNYPYFEGYLCNKMYKAKFIDNFSFRLDETIKMSEDTLFNFNYLQNVNSVSIINLPLYHYCFNENSCMNNKTDYNDLKMLEIIDYFISQTVEENIKNQIIIWAFKYWIRIFDISFRQQNGKALRKNIKAIIKNNVALYLKSECLSRNERIMVLGIVFLYPLFYLYKKQNH